MPKVKPQNKIQAIVSARARLEANPNDESAREFLKHHHTKGE